MAHMSIEERIRNVRYVSEDEMKELKKSHVILDGDGMASLHSDISASMEKGLDASSLSKEEFDNISTISAQYDSAEPVTISGSGKTQWAIERAKAKKS